ncbi:hypothetical protein HRI_002183400 [Hibiscus trionum]|uniref:Uncharacterized protein n=1 Tax=Hibiscus trionum TaxID=183268 RepID=A0A9W7HXF6_HIBTR|nr:hypothetical protein HRI_002183400 [Hibiscus trionum]
MVRKPYLKKGAWTADEDQKLTAYIMRYGIWNWNQMPRFAGLQRSGKSCRLRWMNYLRPNIRRGNFTREEEDTIIHLQKQLGNRWSAIAARLPNRTDNDIKNYWNTRLKKRSVILGNNNSASATTSPSSNTDSSTLLNIPTTDEFPPAGYTTFSTSGSNNTGEVNENYTTDNFVSSETYWEILCFLEQPLMGESFDCESNLQLWRSHSQDYYYDPVDDFWANPLV